ncbi:MAG: MopE-related protein, partial [Deltaproteobacteria bacterium]|nr:MopE-related protein [Deltaproteobacteria bacterium]
EDVDTAKDAQNCGKCGKACEFTNAFATCEGGACKMGDCSTFWYDRNGSDTDGCEVFCQPTAEHDYCNGADLQDTDNPYQGLDDDCDGETDEDVGFDTDPLNCGWCGHVCYFPHAQALCEGGACKQGGCAEGFWDIDTATPGCEYQCTPASPATESCNNRDDDCDGQKDEGNPEGGGPCGGANPSGCDPEIYNGGVCPDGADQGECTAGVLNCVAGKLTCEGAVGPASKETCDNLDNDCDGVTDEEKDIPQVGPGPATGDAGVDGGAGDDGTLCGSSVGACRQGRQRCALPSAGATAHEILCCANVDTDGVCEHAISPQAPDPADRPPAEGAVADCDREDNDCDGRIDEDLADTGRITNGDCVNDTEGECADPPGTLTCFFGGWECRGAKNPIPEKCDGLDNDCDGETDENLIQGCGGADPDGCGPAHDQPCPEGAEEGECRPGYQYCDPTTAEPGAPSYLPCENDVGSSTEICDGLDNDCDGQTDEDALGTGATCGTGICAGHVICVNGVQKCDGSPSVAEGCDGLDNDCDGLTDENVIQLCGGGTVNYPSSVCRQGHQDCDPANAKPGFPAWKGCEGNIDPTAETCDGLNNDCDTETDEEAEISGVGGNCMGALGGVGICGTAVYRCVTTGAGAKTVGCCASVDGANHCVAPQGPAGTDGCNGLDDDCDGQTDEHYSAKGYPCGGGTLSGHENDGLCRQGLWVCDQTSPGLWEVVCGNNALGNPPRGPVSEGTVCDGLDNDCDGTTDEDVTVACGGGTIPGHENDGICRQGYQHCTDPTCHGETPPEGGETCNGLDDDCDGTTDEGNPGGGAACGQGACAGNEACVAGAIICQSSGTEGPEACDGVDNDCDGQTDEDVTQLCGGGTIPGHENDGICHQGSQTCDKANAKPGFPAWNTCIGSVNPDAEECDGLDNDCDGTTDEEIDMPGVGMDPGDPKCAVGKGVCGDAWFRCVSNGVGGKTIGCCASVDTSNLCVPASGVQTEVCDNLDNNCDGQTDEEFLPTGECGGAPGAERDVGRCQHGHWTCNGATHTVSCVGSTDPIPEPDLCNNVDDDCDGQTDELITQPCGGGTFNVAPAICRQGYQYCSGSDTTCHGATPPESGETCNGLDDNCDGTVDEGNPGGGADCGTGMCAGHLACTGGLLVCNGSAPGVEGAVCDGRDNDCDGQTDEGISQVCGGGAVNAPNSICRQGIQYCDAAASTPSTPVWLACQGNTDPVVGSDNCDGVDNDCDGTTDEDQLTAGSCGPPCNDGTRTCVGGILVCQNATAPTSEICDGVDNDCDGSTDEFVTRVCGGGSGADPNAGECQTGLQSCDPALSDPGFPAWFACEGNVDERPEVCDGADNDCDGLTDQSDPSLEAAPGTTCDPDCPNPKSPYCNGIYGWDCDYACTTEGGHVECDAQGNPKPVESLCDTWDNNCDGSTDEVFNTQYDSANCGGCGNDCATMGSLWPDQGNVVPAHVATFGCTPFLGVGKCRINACNAGYWDYPQTPTDYQDCNVGPCTQSNGGIESCDAQDNDCDGATDEGFSGITEICNGVDDDCDGQTDEGATLPPNVCTKRLGECATIPTLAQCAGVSGWDCNYDLLGNHVQLSGGAPVANETLCDGYDNDCDGFTDEPSTGFDTALLGTDCNNSKQGTCLRTGKYKCSVSGTPLLQCCNTWSGVMCSTEVEWNPATGSELCNGSDDDCDGRTDEEAAVNAITVSNGGAWSYQIFDYEASRPDAQSYDEAHWGTSGYNSPGGLSTAACSVAGKIPWTMVTKTEAEQACWKLNPTQVQVAGGWDLCTKAQWQYACQYGNPPAPPHLYPYGDTYAGNEQTCNGRDYSATWDHVMGCGVRTPCISVWKPGQADDLYDLSGNAEEWTSSSRFVGADTLYQIRGGSYNNLGPGMTCTFDFWAARNDFRMPNLGFRCCKGGQPPCFDSNDCQALQYCSSGTCNTVNCSSQYPTACTAGSGTSYTCATALVLTRKQINGARGGYSITGRSLVGSGDDDKNCDNGGSNKNDQFFRFFMYTGESVAITVDPASTWNAAIRLYRSNTACTGTGCDTAAVGCTNNGGFDVAESINYTATQDGWYTLLVDSRTSNPSTYSMSISLTGCSRNDCNCP